MAQEKQHPTTDKPVKKDPEKQKDEIEAQDLEEVSGGVSTGWDLKRNTKP